MPTVPADLAVVLAIHDEAPVLRELHRRLRTVLDSLAASRRFTSEIIAVDDGSGDGSLAILKELAGEDPTLHVIHLKRKGGQHEALIVGLSQNRSPRVVNIDADLQNPPEEIPRIVDALSDGYDHVATRRIRRFDPLWRRAGSRFANITSTMLTRLYTPVPLRDLGCTLRGYSGALVESMVRAASKSGAGRPFLSALALRFARKVCELDVEHAPRGHGKSRYGWLDLLRLYCRLLTTLARGRPYSWKANHAA